MLALAAVILGTAGSAWADDGQLLGVGCHTGMVCIAVGTYVDHATSRPLVEHLGKDVVRQRVPEPRNSIASALNAISCPGRSLCIAVGYTMDPNNHTVPLVERWNGKTWTATTIRPFPEGAMLDSISCPTAHWCTAVGVLNGGPMIEQWNGTTWSSQAVPVPPGPSRPNLGSVSCASATNCMAVGAYLDTERHEQPLAEHWDGSAWSITSAPYSRSRPSSRLLGVSCVGTGWCIAVAGGVIQRWDGTQWSVEQSSRGGAHLQAIYCTSKVSCLAVGRHLVSGHASTFAEVMAGGGWVVRKPQSPSIQDDLLAVSCSASDRCAAIGQGQPRLNTLFTGLSEHWDGRRWTNVHWH